MKKLIALITVIAILLSCGMFATAQEHTAQVSITDDLITVTGSTKAAYIGINVKNVDSGETVFVSQETASDNTYSFSLNVLEYGKYTVTLNDGLTVIKKEVSYPSDMSAAFSANDTLTLYEGEVCGLDAVYKSDSECKELYWATSDKSIVSLFGNAYTTRTIIAKKPGTAIVSISSPAGDVLDKIYITVNPKAEENIRSALFELAGERFPVNKNLLGIHMHTNPIVGEGLTLLKENITFNCLRTGYSPADGQSYSEYSEDFAARLNQHDMTFIINLSRFAKDSAEVLMEQVKEIYKIVKPLQNKVYIEFGNEMYTADISQDDYIAKVKALYPMVKAYSKDIYASVPLLGKYFDDMGHSWDDSLEAISDYFDAVSPHNYTGTSSYNLCTQNIYMENLFASNFYHREANKWVAEKFPGKQIWVTEYGYLNTYMFDTASTVEERRRVQTAKSPGPAIGTAEKFLDMTMDKNIVFANYHAPNDTQGFGMVQEYNGKTDILPGFYIYKELASLINNSDTVYKTKSIYTDKFISKIDSTFAYADKSVDYVGAYCYGGNDGKYIVFVNRGEDKCRTALKGYKLAPVWKYAPEYILGEDYLQRTQDWYAPPEYVEEPEILDEALQSEVTLDGYSITVCRALEATTGTTTTSSGYDREKGIYTLDYTSKASVDMLVNLICLKPGFVPSQIEMGNPGEYIEFSDSFSVEAKGKAVCSFSVKDSSPEGLYNVWIYTEQHGNVTSPYDSFYFLGDEGLITMLGKFNDSTADIAALIEEYSQNKPVLRIERTDYYNENTADVVAIIKAQAPFENCADIEKAYTTSVLLDKINKLTGSNQTDAESIINEFMQENAISKSELFEKYKEEIIADFIEKKPQYTSAGKVKLDLENTIVITIVNSVTQNSEMKKAIKEFAVILGVDYSDYDACNTTNANKYIMSKNFSDIETLKAALKKGINESPKGSDNNGGGSGGGGSSSGEKGGGFSIGGSAPAIVNKDAFNDMNNHVWAKEAVEALMKKGIVSGDGNGLFRPSDSITREEFLKMVIEAFGLTGYKADISFKDAVSGAWYEKYISAACALNITNGRNSEIFGIGEKVTREEMAVFVQRAAKAKGLELVSSGENAFADLGDISGYARSAVNSLSQKGIINGMGENLFMPKENSTRAQAAVIIYRAMNFWEG